MFDKEKIKEELKGVPNDELKENIRKLLYKKDLPEKDVFSLKILIIEELIRKGKLIVLLDDPSGIPYKTRIETLKPQDMDLILKQYLYHSIPLECIVHTEGVIFNHIETT
ncbi:MAG: hypothetical protein WC428_03760 [Candidatus Paceibacterota bacterium]|jgi:hypothetical protein